MPKRLSEIQKKELIESFKRGKTIEELSKKLNFAKITITRHLKKNFGNENFKKLIKENSEKKEIEFEKSQISKTITKISQDKLTKNNFEEETFFNESHFLEIAPLNTENIDSVQKDFASIPILETKIPNIVYMIVDKKIELETKLLKDYPEWQFLSQKDLERKTIEIHYELKNAKKLCSKDQKVIKIPNTNVFKIVAPILRSRGITRIVTTDNLIAL